MTGLEVTILIAGTVVSPITATYRESPLLPQWTREVLCGTTNPIASYINIAYIVRRALVKYAIFRLTLLALGCFSVDLLYYWIFKQKRS